MHTLTRQQLREVDRLAIEELGIPGVVLMENAGRYVAEVVLDFLESQLHLLPLDTRVSVLCGSGNNGGDGYVVTRHLFNAGVAVTAYPSADPARLGDDATINYLVAKKLGIVGPVLQSDLLSGLFSASAPPHIVIDALLGTGFEGKVRDDLGDIIDCCNRLHDNGITVVAIDLPSGLDCDSGQPSNATICADLTVTFIAAKQGFSNPSAEAVVGQVVVADIGAPPQLVQLASETYPSG